MSGMNYIVEYPRYTTELW